MAKAIRLRWGVRVAFGLVLLVGCGGIRFGTVPQKSRPFSPLGTTNWIAARIVGVKPRWVPEGIGIWRVVVDPRGKALWFEGPSGRLSVRNSGLIPQSFKLDGTTRGAEWHPSADAHSPNPHIIGLVKWLNRGDRTLRNLRVSIAQITPSNAAVVRNPDTSAGDLGHPAFIYGGELPGGGETATKEWVFDVPNASPFNFIVQVYADAWHGGWSGVIEEVAWANESIGFAVGEDGLILRTLDGGNTWRVLDAPTSVDLLTVAIAPNNPNIVYVGGRKGTILKTTYGTRTDFSGPSRVRWDILTPQAAGFNISQTDVTDIVTFGDGSLVLACTGEGGGSGEIGVVWRSTDGGQNWTAIDVTAGAGPGLRQFSFVDRDIGYVLGGTTGFYDRVWKTTDGGLSWSGPFPISLGQQFWGLVALDAETVVVVGSEGKILKTTDGAGSWTEKNSGTNDRLVSIARRPTTTGELWVVGFHVALKSPDGGENWSPVSIPDLTRPRSITFASANKASVAGDGATIFIGTGMATTPSWTIKSSGLDQQINAIVMVDDDTGFAFGCFGQVLKTTDGGETWTLITTLNPINDATLVDPTGPVIVAVGGLGDSGVIYRTTDGMNWTQVHTVGTPLQGVSNPSGNGTETTDGLIAVGDGIAVRSLDGGQTWSSIPGTPSITFNDAALTPGTSQPVMIAVGYEQPFGSLERNPRIYRVTNWWTGTPTWSEKTPPTGSGELRGVQMVDSNIGYICGRVKITSPATTQKNVLKTTDGGNTWNAIGPDNDNDYHALHFLDANTGFVVGEDILLTKDGGNTWKVFADFSGPFFAVSARPIPSGWVEPAVWVAGVGTILRYR